MDVRGENTEQNRKKKDGCMDERMEESMTEDKSFRLRGVCVGGLSVAL